MTYQALQWVPLKGKKEIISLGSDIKKIFNLTQKKWNNPKVNLRRAGRTWDLNRNLTNAPHTQTRVGEHCRNWVFRGGRSCVIPLWPHAEYPKDPGNENITHLFFYHVPLRTRNWEEKIILKHQLMLKQRWFFSPNTFFLLVIIWNSIFCWLSSPSI